jgi:hypothetical protein
MRAHVHVEEHIRRLKDSGLCRFPFTNLDTNRTWLATVCSASDLVRWFKLLYLRDIWRTRNPRRALVALARPRPAHPSRPTGHRADPRRLARRARHPPRRPARIAALT